MLRNTLQSWMDKQTGPLLRAKATPDMSKCLLVSPDSRSHGTTYAELVWHVSRLAQQLLSAGHYYNVIKTQRTVSTPTVMPGPSILGSSTPANSFGDQTVAVLCPVSYSFLLATHAIWNCGGVALPLPTPHLLSSYSGQSVRLSNCTTSSVLSVQLLRRWTYQLAESHAVLVLVHPLFTNPLYKIRSKNCSLVNNVYQNHNGTTNFNTLGAHSGATEVRVGIETVCDSLGIPMVVLCDKPDMMTVDDFKSSQEAPQAHASLERVKETTKLLDMIDQAWCSVQTSHPNLPIFYENEYNAAIKTTATGSSNHQGTTSPTPSHPPCSLNLDHPSFHAYTPSCSTHSLAPPRAAVHSFGSLAASVRNRIASKGLHDVDTATTALSAAQGDGRTSLKVRPDDVLFYGLGGAQGLVDCMQAALRVGCRLVFPPPPPPLTPNLALLLTPTNPATHAKQGAARNPDADLSSSSPGSGGSELSPTLDLAYTFWETLVAVSDKGSPVTVLHLDREMARSCVELLVNRDLTQKQRHIYTRTAKSLRLVIIGSDSFADVLHPDGQRDNDSLLARWMTVIGPSCDVLHAYSIAETGTLMYRKLRDEQLSHHQQNRNGQRYSSTTPQSEYLMDVAGDMEAVIDPSSGQMRLRGKPLFSGYHNRQRSTRETFNDEGFFLSPYIGETCSNLLLLTGRHSD
eukprot:GHVQ01023752.1.p1 GENE.GHVQ01023752.1~~GHVQ01023752.1.p1  ORF type:complete len:684 (+),score=57.61 GHVQ01023752.1:201-2252(+)